MNLGQVNMEWTVWAKATKNILWWNQTLRLNLSTGKALMFGLPILIQFFFLFFLPWDIEYSLKETNFALFQQIYLFVLIQEEKQNLLKA